MKNFLIIISFFYFHTIAAQENSDVQIGDQTWASKNLNVKVFLNGDSIKYVKSPEEWAKCQESGYPAYCYYNNDPENGEKFGAIYNWFAMVDSRGIAPNGYHVANDTDWSELNEFLNSEVVNSQNKGISGIKLKTNHSWVNNGADEDTYNLLILLGGCRMINGSFQGIGSSTSVWSKSLEFTYSISSALRSNYIYFQANEINMLIKDETSRNGHYIRCILGQEMATKKQGLPKTMEQIDNEFINNSEVIDNSSKKKNRLRFKKKE